MPCGHLLGKGWSLGSRLLCLTVSLSRHFPIGTLGQVWYLIVSIPDLCTLTMARESNNHKWLQRSRDRAESLPEP